MSFTDELKKKGITQNNISGTTQKTFTQQLEERKNNASTVPNVTNNAIKAGLSIATKSIEGAKQQAPSSINNTVKTGLKLATDTVKQQSTQNFLRNNVALPKQGNYRLPVKSVSMDSIEKKKPTILDIPVMAAKAALEVPGDLKNLSIYGVRALGEAITGQPVESYRPEGYSFVKDILPEAAGNALDKFEKSQPLAGGFTKFLLENTVGDPTNLVGGSGTLGELSKVGFLGNNSITNTVDNLKTIGNLNKKSFATVDKALNKQVDKAMSTVKTIGMNEETAATAEPLLKEPVQTVKTPLAAEEKAKVIELPINKSEAVEIPKQPLKQEIVSSKPKMELSLKNLKDKTKTSLNKFYTNVVDSKKPIFDADKDTGRMASNTSNVSGTVDYIIKDALIDKNGNKIGKSFKEVTSQIPKGDSTPFWEYMLQRHNIDRAREGKNVYADYTSEMSKKYVNDIEKTHPVWKKVADEIVDWEDKFMNTWGVDFGTIDKDVYGQLRNTYKSYIPTNREFSTLEESIPEGASKRYIDQRTPIKKATGSDRNIIDPTENIMNMVNRTVRTARYNEVGQTFLNSIRKNPEGMRKYAEILDEKPAMVTDNIVTVLENGKPTYVQINNEALRDSLNGLPKQVNNAPKMRKITNAYKALITQKNPIFAVRNTLRDVPTAYIYGSTKNPFKFAKGLGSAAKDIVTNSENFQRFKAVGAEGGNFFTSGNSAKSASQLLGKENIVKKVAAAPLRGIEKFNNITEAAPRIAEFNRVFKKTGDVNKALYAANEVTVNFARGGVATKKVDAFVPYLNAGVQGLDRYFRSFKDPKTAIASIIKSGVAITTPTVGLYLVNMNNPNYQALDNRTKDTYYCVPNLLGPRKNGYPSTFIKISKSRESGVVFSTLFERTARAVAGDKNAFKGFMNTVSTSFSPTNPFENNIFAPVVFNLNTNKDFAGRTIVPDSLKDTSPYLQYDENTSSVAKFIGKMFNVSPKQVDYLMDSYTGVIGDILLPATTPNGNPIENVLGRPFIANSLYSNQTMTDFYDNLNTLNTQKADAKQLGNNINTNLQTGFSKISNDISTLRALMKQVENDKSISDKKKQETLKSYQQRILDLGNRANKMYNSNNTSYKSKYPELESDYPEPSFTYKKQTITLNPSQYLEYKKIIDDNIKASLKTNSISSYLNEEDRQKAIESIISKAQDNAKKNMLLKLKIN